MRRIAQSLAITLLIVLVLPLPAEAALGSPISNEEQRVSEHGFRFGADQFTPDISGALMVWQDRRGTNVTHEGNSVWSKNLSTRDESPVTTVATDDAQPRVSGDRVVWTDIVSNNNDVFVKQLPGGSIVPVTTNPFIQITPAIDGTLVVWEDYRNGNIDIFKKDLAGGSETTVVAATASQASPDVSGSTVAWRDNRDGPSEADVYVRTGTNPETKIRDVTGTVSSISEHRVAISGSRVIWNEVDPACGFGPCDGPRILKTCVLPCGSITTVDSVPSGVNGGIVGMDLSGSRAVWMKSQDIDPDPSEEINVSHIYTKDLATGNPISQVDTVAPDEALFSGGRIDGTRVVWDQTGDVQGGIFTRAFSGWMSSGVTLQLRTHLLGPTRLGWATSACT